MPVRKYLRSISQRGIVLSHANLRLLQAAHVLRVSETTVLNEARRLSSVQDQVERLRSSFLILKK